MKPLPLVSKPPSWEPSVVEYGIIMGRVPLSLLPILIALLLLRQKQFPEQESQMTGIRGKNKMKAEITIKEVEINGR